MIACDNQEVNNLVKLLFKNYPSNTSVEREERKTLI